MMELNPQQQEAAEHLHGPLLILAGPGSGKTRVLVNRIANLISSSTAFPSQILAVTFTNKAAGEMRRRVEELVGQCAREIAMGTFHSICLRILRSHHELAGLGQNFVVYDDSDQLALVKECMAELDIDRERLAPRAALDRISRAKDACMGPEEFAGSVGANPYLRKISTIYDLYQKRLGELDAADFGDLIRLAVRLLDEEHVRESYRSRWGYVLVDEYQDTNAAQYRFIEHIAGCHRNICVVGDDDQSIYRWRGADITNILRFEDDFPGAKVVRLEQNYRSTSSILASAQAVVSRNAGRKPKSIWTVRGDGERVRVLTCDSERREAQAVADRVSDAAVGSRRYRDFAVFYRTNAQSRPIEEVFRERGVPYRIYGGIRFYERAEVKDVLAYLRLVVDRKDDVGFLRIINKPARGLGRTTVERLKAFARDSGRSLLESIEGFVETDSCRGAQRKRLVEFRRMIAELSESALERPMGDLLRDVLERSGYVEELVNASTIEAEAKLENINELVAAVEEFIPAGDAAPLTQFLDQVALISDADAVDEEQGAVTLMTLHIAKGLEFPQVFMVGMEEGLLPHARSIDDPDELEEERRLCYVGMTRAKDVLTLSHSFRRRHFGQERYNVVSRFINDVPDEHSVRIPVGMPTITPSAARKRLQMRPGATLYNDGRRTNDEIRKTSDDYDFDQRPPDEREGGIAKGMRVSHPSFGAGIVQSCERTSMGHKVTVKFQCGVTKRLIAELAGLMPA
jgi:DNA helicase-2/ATP-dependent DNA helicase PcrA